MRSFNLNHFLRSKTILIIIFMINPMISWSGGDCNLTATRTIIDNMIKQADVGNKIITPISECILSSDNQNPQKKQLGRFVFDKGRTFRFYIYAHQNDAKLTITQFKGGILKKTNEKLLFQAQKEGTDEQVAYFDYVLDDQIEFVMTFETIGNTNGCAFMKWFVISTPGQ